jgi:glycosyltransferase involved in cell wall biosynthesis
MDMAGRAVRLAEELGVRDRTVFFNFGWVPYAERAAYLLEADVGVSAHLETVEARFAFRTRVLDYLWARLPVVATRGDALADLVRDRGLGHTVDYGDVDGWAAAVESLLDAADGERAARRAAFGAARAEFLWPRVVEPLARLVSGPPSPPPSGTLSAAMVGEHVRRRARLSLDRRGFGGSLRHAVKLVALRARRRR